VSFETPWGAVASISGNHGISSVFDFSKVAAGAGSGLGLTPATA